MLTSTTGSTASAGQPTVRRGTDLPRLGDFNESVILDAVRRHPTGLSRVELAQATWLSAQTVSNITRTGAATDSRNLLFFHLGTGSGTGLVVEDTVLSGVSGNAGEAGGLGAEYTVTNPADAQRGLVRLAIRIGRGVCVAAILLDVDTIVFGGPTWKLLADRLLSVIEPMVARSPVREVHPPDDGRLHHPRRERRRRGRRLPRPRPGALRPAPVAAAGLSPESAPIRSTACSLRSRRRKNTWTERPSSRDTSLS
ncbi:ROK family protein [Streptomyces sp. NPDC058464]|uniref:ROK family protein n=1 Tax=Streptomyces sp. NPDC058464 TaxID=3346511 RepID=UPI00365B772B